MVSDDVMDLGQSGCTLNPVSLGPLFRSPLVAEVKLTMLPVNIRNFNVIVGLLLALVVTVPAFAANIPHVERRCGWYENPTPGNVTLTDREATWLVGMQGGHEAAGPSPQFSDAQWVQTNSGDHGYGCACLTVRTDAARRIVLSISKATALPLAVCRRDKSLREPPHALDIDG